MSGAAEGGSSLTEFQKWHLASALAALETYTDSPPKAIRVASWDLARLFGIEWETRAMVLERWRALQEEKANHGAPK